MEEADVRGLTVEDAVRTEALDLGEEVVDILSRETVDWVVVARLSGDLAWLASWIGAGPERVRRGSR